MRTFRITVHNCRFSGSIAVPSASVTAAILEFSTYPPEESRDCFPANHYFHLFGDPLSDEGRMGRPVSAFFVSGDEWKDADSRERSPSRTRPRTRTWCRDALAPRTILALLLVFAAPASIAASVTLYRDDWGVPHIYADEEALGYYGLGYAEAEDRLLAVFGAMLWMQGRQSELTGAGALATTSRAARHHYEEAQQGLTNCPKGARLRVFHAISNAIWRIIRTNDLWAPG
jgi:hypothetical protein